MQILLFPCGGRDYSLFRLSASFTVHEMTHVSWKEQLLKLRQSSFSDSTYVSSYI